VGILIDTSVLIEVERGRLDLATQLAGVPDTPAYVSVITASELLVGVHRSSNPRQRARRAASVEQVLRSIPVLPIDLHTARVHAELQAACATAGTPVGPHDMWLAATAVAWSLTLVTGNTRELGRVPGLRLTSWTRTGAAGDEQ
jgi:tRNA(fMet)-specific endonuclease VapC